MVREVTGEEKDKGCGLLMHNKCVRMHYCIWICTCLYMCVFMYLREFDSGGDW